MNDSLVLLLQQEALKNNVNVSNLLLKAKTMSEISKKIYGVLGNNLGNNIGTLYLIG
jgi:hypothetical protein